MLKYYLECLKCADPALYLYHLPKVDDVLKTKDVHQHNHIPEGGKDILCDSCKETLSQNNLDINLVKQIDNPSI